VVFIDHKGGNSVLSSRELGRWNVIHGWRAVAAPKNNCDLGVNDKFQSCAACYYFGVGKDATLNGKGKVILPELPSRPPLGKMAGEMSETALWEAIALRIDQTGNSCRILYRMDVSASQLFNCYKANVWHTSRPHPV
jgi:hypothetical protein